MGPGWVPNSTGSQRLLGPVLNLLAGLFHILAKAVGRVAADGDANDREESRDKNQRNETVKQLDELSFHEVILEPALREAYGAFAPSANSWKLPSHRPLPKPSLGCLPD
jgi:hypothetical protein